MGISLLKSYLTKYGYGRDTLSDINLTIKKGSKVSLVGASGSGKTTLAKMIVNFMNLYRVLSVLMAMT